MKENHEENPQIDEESMLCMKQVLDLITKWHNENKPLTSQAHALLEGFCIIFAAANIKYQKKFDEVLEEIFESMYSRMQDIKSDPIFLSDIFK